MEREKIRTSMIWCLDHAESAEEVCVCVSVCVHVLHTCVSMSVWVGVCCVDVYTCV